MILTCPQCATRYFVADDKVGPQGREVRCASCKTRWTAVNDAPLTLSAATTVEEVLSVEDEAPISELPGEALPKVFRARADTDRKVRQAAAVGVVWAGLAAVLTLLVAAGVVFRADVVRAWPRMAGVYAAVGLPVNNLGLIIEGLKAEPSLQNGRAALTITGVLRNIKNRQVTAPPLSVELLNPDGKRVAGKIAAPTDPVIPAGQSRHFAIVMLDPPLTAQDLEMRFVLDKVQAKSAAPAVPAVKAFVTPSPDLRKDDHATPAAKETAH